MDGNRFSRLLIVVALAGSLAALAGCGGDGSSGEAASVPDFDTALADAPPALAAVYGQGDAIIDGGVEGFEKQLADLQGFPVVVNKWASWCGPCREEFPYLQQVAAELGTEVAFLGVDGQDSREAARTFLDSNPLPYPSFFDPDEKIVKDVLGADIGYPATVFYDGDGNITFTKFGPFKSQQDLREHVERYALGRSGSSSPPSG